MLEDDGLGPAAYGRQIQVDRYRANWDKPAYAERQTASAIDPYAHQLAGWLKTEAAKSRKQRRSLKQLHEELVNLGFNGSY